MPAVKREPSLRKQLLMNCELYLFTYDEVALLVRENRENFIEYYLQNGGKITVKNNKKFIMHGDLKNFLNDPERKKVSREYLNK